MLHKLLWVNRYTEDYPRHTRFSNPALKIIVKTSFRLNNMKDYKINKPKIPVGLKVQLVKY